MHLTWKLAASALLACGSSAALAQVQAAAAHAQVQAPGAHTQVQAASARPSVAEIVEKNSAARGGREAWRKMETMAWSGHAESANAPGRVLPFLLEQKRPDRTRFVIGLEGQRSVRVYDGTSGWNVRPDSKGRPETQPYSEEELRFARGAQVIDGPLMDYAAKGAAFTLEGLGQVGERNAYILDVRLPSGGNHRVWVDTETFLELRHDREIHGAYAKPTSVSVFYRNYRAFEGLQIPLIIETVAATRQAKNTLVIDRVALNPQLDDRQFAPPSQPTARHRGVVVDTRSAAAPQSPHATR
jgi:hypothetical protein